MPTTSNFGWTTPADTDLVKDGAAAIRTLGNGIDTSFLDLKGGTTDQVLAKNSNTDLDFKWVAQDDADAIQKSLIDAEGDLIVGDAADAVQRLAIGSNGNVLTVDTSVDGKIKWAAPAASGANWSLLNAGGTALTGASTITVSGISAKDKIFIFVDAASADASSFMTLRFNADAGSNYNYAGAEFNFASTYNDNQFSGLASIGGTGITLGRMSATGGSGVSGYLNLSGCNASGVKVFQSFGAGSEAGSDGQRFYHYGGVYTSASTISSVSIVSGTGNFDSGTIYVYTTA